MKSALNLLNASVFWRTVAISLLFIFSYFLFAITPVHAQYSVNGTEYNTYKGYTSPAENINADVPLNVHNGVQILILEILSAGVCQLAGFDPISNDGKCLGVDSKTGKIGFVENGGGAIALVGSLIDATLVPPASSTQYISYLKNNFGIVKSAHAQQNPCIGDLTRGVGFCGLVPLLPLWETMRNIVYLLFILVFVVIGLGIMLRIHIDPRTVMTLQNQIPKIIVGIIAITFSFAIAGLLIDVMWVAIYLFASVIFTATNPTAVGNETMMNVVRSATPFDAAGHAFSGGIWAISQHSAQAFGDLVSDAIRPNLGLIGDAIGGIVNVLGTLIIFIAIIVALLRLWVTLIITYINVILDVVFAPFWILAGLVPGGSLGLGAWLKDIIANLAVFPVAIGFFMLGSYFVESFASQDSANRLMPPLIGGTNPEAVAALIGLGFILMLPNLLTTMKAALKAPKINFGPIFGPVGTGAGFVMGVPRSVGQISLESRALHSKADQSAPNGIRYGNVGTPKAILNKVFGK